MITQRFRPVVWVVGVAAAATMLYMVSLQVASERGRLEAIDARIAETRREIRQLQTELGTRANLRQLERWNGEALALSAPSAEQYLADEGALGSFDQGVLAGKTDAPAVMFAEAAALTRAADVVTPAAERPVLISSSVPAPTVASQPKTKPSIEATAKRPVSQTALVETDRATKLTKRDREVQKILASSAPARSGAPRTVASINKELLDRTTLGDIGRGATAEAVKGGRARP